MIGEPIWTWAARKKPASDAISEQRTKARITMRPVAIPSRRDEVSSRPTARIASPVRVRYSQTSRATASTTTPMKAIGTKPTLVVRPSMTSLLIGPSGWSRRSSDAPWRMLSVPSVAMIDGSPSTRISVALKSPVASPTADEREAPGSSAQPDVSASS